MTHKEMISAIRSTKNDSDRMLILKQYTKEKKQLKMQVSDLIYNKVKDTKEFKEYVVECYTSGNLDDETYDEWFNDSIFSGKMNVEGMKDFLGHMYYTLDDDGFESYIESLGIPELIKDVNAGDKDVYIIKMKGDGLNVKPIVFVHVK